MGVRAYNPISFKPSSADAKKYIAVLKRLGYEGKVISASKGVKTSYGYGLQASRTAASYMVDSDAPADLALVVSLVLSGKASDLEFAKVQYPNEYREVIQAVERKRNPSEPFYYKLEPTPRGVHDAEDSVKLYTSRHPISFYDRAPLHEVTFHDQPSKMYLSTALDYAKRHGEVFDPSKKRTSHYEVVLKSSGKLLAKLNNEEDAFDYVRQHSGDEDLEPETMERYQVRTSNPGVSSDAVYLWGLSKKTGNWEKVQGPGRREVLEQYIPFTLSAKDGRFSKAAVSAEMPKKNPGVPVSPVEFSRLVSHTVKQGGGSGIFHTYADAKAARGRLIASSVDSGGQHAGDYSIVEIRDGKGGKQWGVIPWESLMGGAMRNPDISAAQQGRLNAMLDKQIRDRDGGVYTYRELIAKRMREGWKPQIESFVDNQATNKLKREFKALQETMLRKQGRGDISKDEYLAWLGDMQHQMDYGVKVPSYYLASSDDRMWDLGKMLYDYAVGEGGGAVRNPSSLDDQITEATEEQLRKLSSRYGVAFDVKRGSKFRSDLIAAHHATVERTMSNLDSALRGYHSLKKKNPSPYSQSPNPPINRLLASPDALASDYKARGMSRDRSWSQFVIDRGLSPGINAKDFYYYWDRATPKLLVSKEEKEEAARVTYDDPESKDFGRKVRVTIGVGRHSEEREGTIYRTLQGSSGDVIYEVDFGDGPQRLRSQDKVEFLNPGVYSQSPKDALAWEVLRSRGKNPLKTKLDMLLDTVEHGKREVTIDVRSFTEDQKRRVIETAEARGLDASSDGNFVLVRELRSRGKNPAEFAHESETNQWGLLVRPPFPMRRLYAQHYEAVSPSDYTMSYRKMTAYSEAGKLIEVVGYLPHHGVNARAVENAYNSKMGWGRDVRTFTESYSKEQLKHAAELENKWEGERENPSALPPGEGYLWGKDRTRGWKKLQGPFDRDLAAQYQVHFAKDTAADSYAGVPFSGFANDDRPRYTEFFFGVKKPKESWEKKGKRNPEGTAADLYETFHGKEAEEVTTHSYSEHEHEFLTQLGALVQLKVITPFNKECEIDSPDPDKARSSDVVHLCANEEGTQIYLVGGDQALDEEALNKMGFKKGSNDFKDKMLLGDLVELTYRTAKGFDKFVPCDYYHQIGESSGVLPVLLYDPISELLSIAGGQYITTSAGLEN